MTNLTRVGADAAEQMRLDLGAGAVSGAGGPAPGPWHQASGAVDAIRDRFGEDAVGPAALLESGRLRLKRPGDTQWGPDDSDTNSNRG